MLYLFKIKTYKKDYLKWIFTFIVMSFLVFNSNYVNQFQEYVFNWFFNILGYFIKPANIGIIKYNFVGLLYLVLFFLLIRYVLNRQFTEFISVLNKFRIMRFGLGVSLFGFAYVFLVFIEVFIKEYTFSSQVKFIDFLELVVVLLVVIPIKSLFTELFFRAFLSKFISLFVKRNWLIIIILAFIYLIYQCYRIPFSMYSFPLLFYIFFMGIFFAVLLFINDGIELSMSVSFVNSFISTLFISQKWYNHETDALFHSTQTEENVFFNYYLPIIIFSIFLVLIIKILRIENWREKVLTTIN